MSTVAAVMAGVIHLYPGYVTKVACEGRLFVSAVGNDQQGILSALPKEIGCGVLLKPVGGSGRTNLLLETSTGAVSRVLDISASKPPPHTSDLTYHLPGWRL